MSKMNYFFCLTVVFFILSTTAKAQFITGGNVSLDYEDGYFFDANPQIGIKYKIFESGLAPFVSYRESNSFLAYGIRAYTQANVVQNIFLHVELQAANVETKQKKRIWVLGMPMGAGYQHKIADNMWAKASILYDVFHNENSPQRNPIVRFGVTYKL